MTGNNKATKSTKQNPQSLNIKDDQSKSNQRKMAEVQQSPIILNTVTTQCFTKSFIGEVDLTEAVEVMKEKSEKIIAGDLSELEAPLAAQVVALNAIFTTLTKRATTCEYLNQVETNL